MASWSWCRHSMTDVDIDWPELWGCPLGLYLVVVIAGADISHGDEASSYHFVFHQFHSLSAESPPPSALVTFHMLSEQVWAALRADLKEREWGVKSKQDGANWDRPVSCLSVLLPDHGVVVPVWCVVKVLHTSEHCHNHCPLVLADLSWYSLTSTQLNCL